MSAMRLTPVAEISAAISAWSAASRICIAAAGAGAASAPMAIEGAVASSIAKHGAEPVGYPGHLPVLQLLEAQQADPPGVDAEGEPVAPVLARGLLAPDPGHQLARDLDGKSAPGSASISVG